MVILCCAALTGCATTRHAGAPEGAIDVIAHRGASAYAPENTLSAFELAVTLGADWYELDCTLTKDGEVIVIHDKELDRTTTGTGLVADHTLEELKALDAGSWFGAAFVGEKLPTLRESLEMAKGRIGVYVEIKNSDDDRPLFDQLLQLTSGKTSLSFENTRDMMPLVEASGTRNLRLTRECIKIIRDLDMEKEVVIQSFSPVVCFVALQEAPGIRVEFLGSKNKDNPDWWGTFLDFGYAIGVDGFNVHHESLDAEQLANFHRSGKTSAVWTVDDPPLMERLAGWGIDGIITNKPDECLKVLRPMGKHP